MNTDDIVWRARRALADGLNDAADDLAGLSITEAPVETGELRGSARYPANDPDSRATAEGVPATVSFNTPYAAAQHEGKALQHRHHPVVPIKKGGAVVGFYTDVTKIKEHEVLWVVHKHPGGGKGHYLEDPFKAMTPRYEAYVAAKVKQVFGG